MKIVDFGPKTLLMTKKDLSIAIIKEKTFLGDAGAFSHYSISFKKKLPAIIDIIKSEFQNFEYFHRGEKMLGTLQYC